MINPDLPPSAQMPVDQPNKAKDPTATGVLSQSPWAKMFPEGATQKQLKIFINTFIRELVRQIAHSDQVHKENLEKQKREMEEGS